MKARKQSSIKTNDNTSSYTLTRLEVPHIQYLNNENELQFLPKDYKTLRKVKMPFNSSSEQRNWNFGQWPT